MANNKSPGSNGFAAHFSSFPEKIGHFSVSSLNNWYENGKLSCTQKQGIITCKPQKGMYLYVYNLTVQPPPAVSMSQKTCKGW